jgi:hypothetical protein
VYTWRQHYIVAKQGEANGLEGFSQLDYPMCGFKSVLDLSRKGDARHGLQSAEKI